jgi:hypothetical protein
VGHGGWSTIVPAMDPVNYLIYQIISLTVLFVGMVGLLSALARIFPVLSYPYEIPEVLFTIFYYKIIVWPRRFGFAGCFILGFQKMGIFVF